MKSSARLFQERDVARQASRMRRERCGAVFGADPCGTCGGPSRDGAVTRSLCHVKQEGVNPPDEPSEGFGEAGVVFWKREMGRGAGHESGNGS
ncbi:hypothetical protein Z043_120322 [Scleropages formosus]|uniref:Uncharacterized protein n=1 Tax=Scleropages formosus TaxID=113540 RepID=A0A0P7WK76_SCLFO|nr:hypothetical protein Z043_120322 [Scleropages formosus]